MITNTAEPNDVLEDLNKHIQAHMYSPNKCIVCVSDTHTTNEMTGTYTHTHTHTKRALLTHQKQKFFRWRLRQQ